ncbi:MAG: TIGR01777 family oxidoreductase [Deltaproteobacteria bacterium]|nr:TIGR01777 family oxidoreductase [Deltaproteobacteria bacterium]
MKIFITGGLGFVGKNLSRFLLEKGHHVIATGTRDIPDSISNERFEYIQADTTETGDWQAAAAQVDVVVNLAGRSIFKRWDDRYKKQLRDSRILTTRNIVDALEDGKTSVLCSTSAVGYYGDRADDILMESEPPMPDFLGNLSLDWEAEALGAEKKGVRVVLPRFGMVLGRGGGALAKMLPAFKSFVGGPLGSGKQWFPWIHMADVLGGLNFLIETAECRGPFNLCSPAPIRNRDFSATLGKVLGRPAVMPVPSFMIRLVMGELGGVLLSSQRAVPHNLLEAGYRFRFADLPAALADLTGDEKEPQENREEPYICPHCGDRNCECHKS